MNPSGNSDSILIHPKLGSFRQILDFPTNAHVENQVKLAENKLDNSPVHTVKCILLYVYFKSPHSKIPQHKTKDLKIDVIMWVDL